MTSPSTGVWLGSYSLVPETGRPHGITPDIFTWKAGAPGFEPSHSSIELVDLLNINHDKFLLPPDLPILVDVGGEPNALAVYFLLRVDVPCPV